MDLWWVSQSCLHCLAAFVALPAADSGERPTAALPGCRPAHVALVQADPPRCIPSHLSLHSSTCILLPDLEHLHSSSIPRPLTTFSCPSCSGPLSWPRGFPPLVHQHILQLSSVPPAPYSCCYGEMPLVTAFWNLNGYRAKNKQTNKHVLVSIALCFRSRYSWRYEGSFLNSFKQNIYNL